MMSVDYIDALESKEQFLDRVYRKGKSYEAKEQARSAINNLNYFCKAEYGKSEEEILKELSRQPNPGKIIQILKGFVFWCGQPHPEVQLDRKRHMKKKSPATIRPYLTQIRKYMKFCFGIRINDDDYRDYVLDIIEPNDNDEEPEPLTKEELRAIIDNAPHPRRKTLYMVAKDTAGRMKELLQLKKENFDFTKKYPIVTFPKSITKGRRKKKETRLTPETTSRVKILLNSLNDDDYVFSTNPGNIKAAKQNEEVSWRNLVTKLGFIEKYKSNGRIKKNFHSIRAFTQTRIKQATKDRDYADFYAGNTRYLSQYIRLEEKEKEELFERCIPHLSIYDTFEVIDQDQRIDKLEEELASFRKEQEDDKETKKMVDEIARKYPEETKKIEEKMTMMFEEFTKKLMKEIRK